MVGKSFYVAVVVSAFFASSAYAQNPAAPSYPAQENPVYEDTTSPSYTSEPHVISQGSCDGHATGCATSQGCAPGLHGHFGGGYFNQMYAEAQDRVNKFSADFQLQYARNRVWPQPFACRDRALYYQILQTHIDAGWEYAFTLTDNHFDRETNKLNTAGESKIAWIMRTAPQHRKSIYVYQAAGDENIDTRLAAVRTVINRWYGDSPSTQVAATTNLPQGSDAHYMNTVNENYLQSLPTPVLNASIGGSVADQ